jgi:apolipoprotein N-acyltransferase
VVAPDGTVLERLPERSAGSVVADVPLASTTTWAVRAGPWPARVVWVGAGLALLVGLWNGWPTLLRRKPCLLAGVAANVPGWRERRY